MTFQQNAQRFTIMKYFKNRQNPLRNVSETELDSLFQLLVEIFHYDWLNSKGNHPIQQLWQRKDALSTNELFTLATSIANLKKINNEWVAYQIKQILSSDINNQRGAFWEIIGLNSILSEKYKLHLPKKNQPGIDATISFNHGGKLNLSLKNYTSSHYNCFMHFASNSKDNILGFLRENYNANTIQIFIDQSNRYPSTNDWAILNNNIPNIFAHFNGEPISLELDSWHITISRIVDKSLHTGFLSYTIVITSVYHENESKNLISKFEQAAENMINVKTKDDDFTLNCLFLNLPITASAKNCFRWAMNYFNENTDTPIHKILFYQAANATDTKNDTNAIYHFYQPLLNNRYKGVIKNYGLSVTIPVGKPTAQPTYFKLTNERGDELSVDNRYIYQKGEHFTKTISTGKEYKGNIRYMGPGIRQHMVLQLSPNEKPVPLEGNFGEDLLLF